MILGLALVLPSTALDSDFKGSGYEPLNAQEAEAWLRSIDLDELIEFTIHAKYVQNALPIVKIPDFTVLVTDTQVIVIPDTIMSISIGNLSWDILTGEIRSAYEPLPGTPGWIYGLAGATVGGVAVWVLLWAFG